MGPDGTRVRRMEEGDLGQVEEIEAQSFSLPWSGESLAAAMRDPSNIYLVACRGDKVQGFCGLWGVAGEGQISHVAVREGFRGRGIGTALLSRLLEEGEGAGIRAFTLEARVSNAAALRLYEKLGFRGVGIRRGFYDAPKEDAVILWRGNGPCGA